jgi:hypothetical protein
MYVNVKMIPVKITPGIAGWGLKENGGGGESSMM